jgi:aminopeptidase N
MRLRSVFWDVIGVGRLEPRTMEVSSVADAAGRPLEFEHEAGRLLVYLDAAAPKGRPLQLTFQIRGDFLIRPAGDSFWMLGTYPWFPQPAEPGGQAYVLRTTISVPKPFVPFAPGKTLVRRADGDRNVVSAELSVPVQFASVLAGKYSSEEETRGPLTIRISSYAMKNPRAMKQLRNFAFGIIEFYERFLGPFPFPELDIIEINDWGFGQAPPGVIFITQEAFNPLQGEINQLFSQGINERFAHEIAHQWWGGCVRTPDEENEWIAESFAEYCAALFLKAAKSQSTYDNLVSSWRGRAGRASEAAPIVLANRVDVPDSATQFEVRTGLLYDKGALVLATLHKELGEQTFLTFLKSYQTSFKGKTASTSTVEGLLEFLTKKDYTDFFNRYVWGTEMPPK